MSNSLVIVESPSKSKTLESYLGKDFKVLASYGHVRDLLPKKGAVDPDNNFAMIELDKIAVKGKTDAVKIYTTLGEYKIINNTMNWVMPANQHEKFLKFYRNKNWVLALKWANDLRNEFDGMLSSYYDMMINRIEELQGADLPDEWDGVYRATSK